MSLAKPMQEVSVDEILQNYNLVVPEIQREYVWGFNQYGIFETFIKDIKDGFEDEGELTPEMISLQATINSPVIDETTRKTLVGVLEGLKKPAKSLNIGFLYSYKPGYYIGNDREEDLYLIDGQQRFTTLFLILFYFSIKENRKEDFESLFKFNAAKEKIAFDYRVRSITHQFIIDLIAESSNVGDLLQIREKRWFLSNYANDVTVKSIVGEDDNSGVFKLLNQAFADESRFYFDFVRKEIKFWHFKTEETSQGEELYITMNSRGQQLADNETIRARLFENEDVKNNALEWSEKWEIWQDFFWKNRDKQSKKTTADEGFNEFLRWVQLLKMYDVEFSHRQSGKDNKAFEKVLQWEPGSQLDIRYLALKDIEIAFEALRYLYNDYNSHVENTLKSQYSHCVNFDFLSKSWLGNKEGNISIIELFQLLPLLKYCVNVLKHGQQIDAHAVLRLTRALYSLSEDETIGKAVREQVVNVLAFVNSLDANEDITAALDKSGLSKTILNDELRTKLIIYKEAENRVLAEDLIWFAEDIAYNDGEVKHLIDYVNSQLSAKPNYFDVDKFKAFAYTYKELIENEDTIWGDLLGSQVYINHWDRVCYSGDWYKKEDFLNFTEERLKNNGLELPEFLVKMRKIFISQYEGVEELKIEASAKKQLYIYYIAQLELLNNNIGWWENERWNFGMHSSYKGFSSLFDKGYIFQSINNQFRDLDYRILYIHQPKIHKKISLEALMAWARQ
jgi:uncharacterized protein with ParB-like and HNH nuclease domain